MWAVDMSPVHYRLEWGVTSRYGVAMVAAAMMMSRRSAAQVSRFIGVGSSCRHSQCGCVSDKWDLRAAANLSHSVFLQFRRGSLSSGFGVGE
jgi:hypothetical protein